MTAPSAASSIVICRDGSRMAEVCRQQPMVVTSVCAFTDSKPNYHSQVQAYRRAPRYLLIIEVVRRMSTGLVVDRGQKGKRTCLLSVLYKDMTALAPELPQVVLKH
jgi:hypothetical protein